MIYNYIKYKNTMFRQPSDGAGPSANYLQVNQPTSSYVEEQPPQQCTSISSLRTHYETLKGKPTELFAPYVKNITGITIIVTSYLNGSWYMQVANSFFTECFDHPDISEQFCSVEAFNAQLHELFTSHTTPTVMNGKINVSFMCSPGIQNVIIPGLSRLSAFFNNVSLTFADFSLNPGVKWLGIESIMGPRTDSSATVGVASNISANARRNLPTPVRVLVDATETGPDEKMTGETIVERQGGTYTFRPFPWDGWTQVSENCCVHTNTGIHAEAVLYDKNTNAPLYVLLTIPTPQGVRFLVRFFTAHWCELLRMSTKTAINMATQAMVANGGDVNILASMNERALTDTVSIAFRKNASDASDPETFYRGLYTTLSE